MTLTGWRPAMLISCAIAIVSLIAGLATSASSDTSGIAALSFLVLALDLVVLWIMGLYLSARVHAWGWFLNDLLYPGIALPLHALVGPVTASSAPLASLMTSSPLQSGDGDSRWEYMQVSLPLPPGVTGMLMSVRLGTEAQAKAFFWGEFNRDQDFGVLLLQQFFDQGWQYANPLGLGNLQIRIRRKFMADPVQCVLIGIATLTLFLIPVALYVELRHYRQIYEPSGFTITLKRAKGATQ